MEVTVPHDFTPREYQLDYLRQLYKHKRAIHVWHRRGGKDLTDFIYTITQAFNRIGNYWHIFPEYKQARKAIWEAKTKDGRSYLSFIPKEAIKRLNNQEMTIEFINGSIWQLIGGDNVDSIVGSGPVGVVFSEWSLQRPSTWLYIEPMLLENGGWAIFNFTPRGENHAYELYTMAENNPKWLTSLLTIDDTGVVSKEQIEELRVEGRPEEIIQQEYYCSFEGSIHGAYYADVIKKAKEQGRITSVPYDGNLDVDTWWDIGVSDSTAIWFTQTLGREIRFIDYLEDNGHGLPYYYDLLNKREYIYGKHHFPHDAGSRSFATGKSTEDIARELGMRFDIGEKTGSVINDINAARGIFSRCWFDAERCKAGIEALKQYRKEYDEKKSCFKPNPLHDWTSHCADAFRYFAVGYKDKRAVAQRPITMNQHWQVF